MSSIGWKIKWNASATHADVASLSSKKWNLDWECPQWTPCLVDLKNEAGELLQPEGYLKLIELGLEGIHNPLVFFVGYEDSFLDFV